MPPVGQSRQLSRPAGTLPHLMDKRNRSSVLSSLIFHADIIQPTGIPFDLFFNPGFLELTDSCRWWNDMADFL
jgi:hypothetical protein